jgi:hypothetical protein
MAIYTTYKRIKGVRFEGERIWAVCWDDAQRKAESRGLELAGKLMTEIPCDELFNPDWDNAIHYDKVSEN